METITSFWYCFWYHIHTHTLGHQSHILEGDFFACVSAFVFNLPKQYVSVHLAFGCCISKQASKATQLTSQSTRHTHTHKVLNSNNRFTKTRLLLPQFALGQFLVICVIGHDQRTLDATQRIESLVVFIFTYLSCNLIWKWLLLPLLIVVICRIFTQATRPNSLCPKLNCSCFCCFVLYTILTQSFHQVFSYNFYCNVLLVSWIVYIFFNIYEMWASVFRWLRPGLSLV